MHHRETHPSYYFIEAAVAKQFMRTRQEGVLVIHMTPETTIQGEYARNGMPRKLTDNSYHKVVVSWKGKS